MTTPAATVQTRAGIKGYGPKCAAVMGIGPSKASAPQRAKSVPANIWQDERQMDWLMEVA